MRERERERECKRKRTIISGYNLKKQFCTCLHVSACSGNHPMKIAGGVLKARQCLEPECCKSHPKSWERY